MKAHIKTCIHEALHALQAQAQLNIPATVDVRVDEAKNPEHGDFATNIALMLAKQLGRPPKPLAKQLAQQLNQSSLIESAEVAGPGFINLVLAPSALQVIVSDVLNQGADYGRSQIGAGQHIHLEFVSSNPTGPLHVGHGRGAAYGATMANILRAVGYNVHCEYYVNDAGRQMDILTLSVWLRYLTACGETKIDFPEQGYKGEYVTVLADKLLAAHGQRWYHTVAAKLQDIQNTEQSPDACIDAMIQVCQATLGDDYPSLHQAAKDHILDSIHHDLADFGVTFDHWASEAELVTQGAIAQGIDRLRAQDAVYEQDGALWFKAEQYGDEKDRVLLRADGRHTYFGADVAYHYQKFSQDYAQIIDVFGADHHGYVPRIKAFLRALGCDVTRLKVWIVQFARLFADGQALSMSTRGGQFVTLRALYEEVGVDAARYFYIMRKMDQHLDFDMTLAKSKSNENPVYYIQYAHARICSVFRQLEEKALMFNQAEGLAALSLLDTPAERYLLRRLALFPTCVLQVAERAAPHSLAQYLQTLATEFHAFYNAQPILGVEATCRQARLCLLRAVQQVLQNGLTLLGVSAPKQM